MKNLLILLLGTMLLSGCNYLYKKNPEPAVAEKSSKNAKKHKAKIAINKDSLETPPFYKSLNSNMQGT
jgi:hypothetical protein